ncbi:PREDICTED: uncharacterized protein LOC106323719 [Brassica oleracea var. oleracea]|uniref:uncharacterized protein LOC106323719 n=1 Tax=Brassica oleracea var. oleracea TaxID=109376 RepID=UPI0006A73E83|nr:PREDICTED: uncharacterized protein LOC106323719 [Brassica oleracea var. oleracea]
MADFGTPEQMAMSMQQMQQQMQQMQELHQTIAAQQLAAQREPPVPIGERNLPRNIPATRSAIAPPPCQRVDFEIKPAMINLVQRKMFHRLSTEIPMEHIEAFEEICSFTRANGVPPDYIKCMLFPFSLANKASRWLKSLPTAKTAALRNKISSFKQLASEPFKEAWERFNNTLRECPHHGFDDDNVLGIFYDGVEWEFRNALNAASNGDFMISVNSMDTRKIDDLAAKVDLMLKNSQNQIYVMEETNLEPGTTDAAAETETSEEDQQEAAPATASGPPDELKGMMQQLLQGQQIQGKALNQVTTKINTRMDNMFTKLNSKYDAVASHIRQMDVQIAQTAETIKRQQGTLPGKTDKNPKDCNAVELRSGRHLSDPVPKKLTAQEKGK